MKKLGIVITLTSLIIYPWIATNFFVLEIAVYAMILGTIALSLATLAGLGGMVSLSQMTVAGIAGYVVAMLGTNGTEVLGLGWPTPVVVLAAVAIATIAGTIIGLISIRTQGIYTIMITLAIAVTFFFFTRQNHEIFNGFEGFSIVHAPVVAGMDLGNHKPFYYIALAITTFWFVTTWYLRDTTFGLAMRAIADNPRRAETLGYSVAAHKVALHAIAAMIAGSAGVMLVWFNGRISPTSVGVDVSIDILIIAIIGGIRHPIGPYLGAILFVMLDNFAIDLIDRERFNLVIGCVFLTLIWASPDGIWGIILRIFNRNNHKKQKDKNNTTSNTISA